MINRTRHDLTRRFTLHIIRLSLNFIKKQMQLAIVCVICIFLIYILNTSKFSGIIKGAIQDEVANFDNIISLPMQNIKDIIGINIDKLHAWYHDISYDTTNLSYQNLSYLSYQNSLLLSEINQLKKSLSYISDANYQFITTRIVHSSSGLLGPIFLLNVGYKDGIALGSAVIKNGVLLGIITEVNEKSSSGFYLNNHNLHTPVVVVPSHKSAIIVGDNRENASLSLLYIAKEELIDQNLIVTAGDGKGIPYGLLVATIENGKIHHIKEKNANIVHIVVSKNHEKYNEN